MFSHYTKHVFVLILFCSQLFFNNANSLTIAEQIKERSTSLKVMIMAMYDSKLSEEIKKIKEGIRNNSFNQCAVKLVDLIDKCDFANGKKYLKELKEAAAQYSPEAEKNYCIFQDFFSIKKNINSCNYRQNYDEFSFSNNGNTIFNYFDFRANMHINCLSKIDKIDHCWIFVLDRLVDYHTNDSWLAEIYFKLTNVIVEIMIDKNLNRIIKNVNFSKFSMTKHTELNHALYFVMQSYLSTVYPYFYLKLTCDHREQAIQILNDLIILHYLIEQDNISEAKIFLEREMGKLLVFEQFLSDKDKQNFYKIVELANLSIDAIQCKTNEILETQPGQS